MKGKLLIMDAGSFRTFGGAAKTAYDTYIYFKNRGYAVDLFGDFSKLDNKVKPVEVSGLSPGLYDAVFMNSIRDVPVVRSLLRPASHTRFIYTDRGNVIINSKKAGVRRVLPKMIARELLAREMRKWLDIYVAITADQEEAARRFFSGATRVVAISNWYSPDFRKMKGRNLGNAIYVGRLDERQKKVRFLIEGIREFVDRNPRLSGKTLLRIVGSGPDEQSCKSLSMRLGLGKNISFHSFVSRDELIRLYNDSAFFVSSSEWEGMAGTFVEAMACGLPLLINERNNTLLGIRPKKSLVENRINGLIYRYGDLDSFAGEFGMLYFDSEMRKRMGKNALRLSHRFSMESSMRKYERLVSGSHLP